MKLIVAGGRDYQLTDADYQILSAIIELHQVTEIVQGGALGVDAAAKQFAGDVGLAGTEFAADWAKYGRAAGPIRNQQMAEYSDALLIFPGGIGTQSMLNIARAKKMKIFKSSDFK